MKTRKGLSPLSSPRNVSSILSTSKAREELVVPEVRMEEGLEGQEEMEEESPQVVCLVGGLLCCPLP